jgi:hypothetical protein
LAGFPALALALLVLALGELDHGIDCCRDKQQKKTCDSNYLQLQHLNNSMMVDKQRKPIVLLNDNIATNPKKSPASCRTFKSLTKS